MMLKQTLHYDSREDPLGRFIVYEEDNELVIDVEAELRRRAIKYLLSRVVPFS